MLAGAIMRVALGLSLPMVVLAGSGKLDDLIVGWYQIQQALQVLSG